MRSSIRRGIGFAITFFALCCAAAIITWANAREVPTLKQEVKQNQKDIVKVLTRQDIVLERTEHIQKTLERMERKQSRDNQ